MGQGRRVRVRESVRGTATEGAAVTTYRESCGSHLGMRLHQTAGEPPCGTCATAEAWRRIYPETVPQRPPPRPEDAAYAFTEQETAAHRQELLAATLPRHLRVVEGAA